MGSQVLVGETTRGGAIIETANHVATYDTGASRCGRFTEIILAGHIRRPKKLRRSLDHTANIAQYGGNCQCAAGANQRT
jgi:hypothetical protein